MQTAVEQGRVHQEMQALEKEVEKRDSDIQQLQKQLKEAEHILVTDMSRCTFISVTFRYTPACLINLQTITFCVALQILRNNLGFAF